MSTLKVNAIQNTSGVTQYLAKAWVNFNGTGTVAIRASGNISSITDNGVGTYTVNLLNAQVDANYSVVGASAAVSLGDCVINFGNSSFAPAFSTTSFRVYTSNFANAANDKEYNFVALFR